MLNISFLSGMASIFAEKRKFFCKLCGKDFTTKFRMRTHLETHSETRNLYQCELCLKTFTWSHNLHRHLKTVHYNETVVSCD